MGYESFKFESDKKSILNYIVYLPKSYTSNVKWPLILSLHGAGERGTDINVVKRWGIHKILMGNDNLPFIVVSPQLPEGEIWEMKFNLLSELLDKIESNYNIDCNRIYLTGYSLGGYGTWNFAILNPERFAAIVPVSGGAISPQRAKRLNKLPIWIAHGDSDSIVPIEESKRIFDSLRRHNSNIIFRIFIGAGHEVCTTAYEESKLFEWLLEQRKEK